MVGSFPKYTWSYRKGCSTLPLAYKKLDEKTWKKNRIIFDRLNLRRESRAILPHASSAEALELLKQTETRSSTKSRLHLTSIQRRRQGDGRRDLKKHEKVGVYMMEESRKEERLL